MLRKKEEQLDWVDLLSCSYGKGKKKKRTKPRPKPVVPSQFVLFQGSTKDFGEMMPGGLEPTT